MRPCCHKVFVFPETVDTLYTYACPSVQVFAVADLYWYYSHILWQSVIPLLLNQCRHSCNEVYNIFTAVQFSKSACTSSRIYMPSRRPVRFPHLRHRQIQREVFMRSCVFNFKSMWVTCETSSPGLDFLFILVFLPPAVWTANMNYAGSLCLAVQLVLCVGKEELSDLEHPIVYSGTAAEEREAHVVWGLFVLRGGVGRRRKDWLVPALPSNWQTMQRTASWYVPAGTLVGQRDKPSFQSDQSEVALIKGSLKCAWCSRGICHM